MKILVLTGLDPRKSFNSGGVRTYNLNLIKIADYLGYDIDFYETKKIINLLRLNKKIYMSYDIILINVSVYDSGFIKLMYELLRIKDKKVIVQCHGGSFHTLRFKTLYKLLFRKIINNKVDLFLVLNKTQKNSLKEKFMVSDNKILQIPNFVENSYDIKNKNIEGILKFFYIGRITEEKGIFDFAEAFMEIKNNNIEFNVVGAGPDEKRLLALVKKDKRIIYHGKKFGQEKEKLFHQNHVFIFLTRLQEGFPISVLEALNFGMCILSSRFPNSERLVINNYNGFIVERNKQNIKNKIKYLIENKELIKEFGMNSKTILEQNFSLEKQGIETYKFIFQ